jgi:hypothetical protein
MKKSIIFTCVIILMILISGCQTNKPGANEVNQNTESILPSDTPVLTNTPEPTSTPIPTETPAPTNTEIPPTETFTPTFTPLPSPTQTLELGLRIYIYNYCEVPVNLQISGPLSVNLLLDPKEEIFIDAPFGTYSFWNDKNRKRTNVLITGSTFPYCICTRYCHVE